MQCIFKDKNILVLHMKIRVSFTREGVMLRMKFLDKPYSGITTDTTA